MAIDPIHGLASRGPKVEDTRVPGLNRWLWMDYVARDPAGALTFYGSAVGFRNEVYETREVCAPVHREVRERDGHRVVVVGARGGR